MVQVDQVDQVDQVVQVVHQDLLRVLPHQVELDQLEVKQQQNMVRTQVLVEKVDSELEQLEKECQVIPEVNDKQE